MSSSTEQPPKNRAWAKIVFHQEIDRHPVIEIADDQFTIGRSPSNILCLRDVKYISGIHCIIGRSDDGRAYVLDMSVNGTMIKDVKIGRNKRMEIGHDTIVYLVRKKSNPAADISFTFYLQEAMQNENNETLRYTPEHEIETEARSTGPVGLSKETNIGENRSETQHTSTSTPSAPSQEPKDPVGCHENNTVCPAIFNAATLPEIAAELTVTTSPNENIDLQAGSSASGSTKPKNVDKIADNLLCAICCEIIHDCISLQPCMHSFCAGCYSDWMSRSKICPECRVEVERVSKNHMVNNVIDAYLAEHPEKKRPEEETKELDAKNKISSDMLYPKAKKRKLEIDDYVSDSDDDLDGSYHDSLHLDCGCSSCDDSSSDSESSSSDDTAPKAATGAQATCVPPGAPRSPVFAFSARNKALAAAHPRAVPPRPTLPQCRSCAGFRFPFPVGQAPPQIQQRPCPPGQAHIMCQCCFLNMPDRRRENNPAVPPVTCRVCQRAFCNLYFGCGRIGCPGCFAYFKDMNFGDAEVDNVINENHFESTILKNYLQSKTKTWRDLLTECLQKLDANQYHCPDKATHNITSETPLCRTCALRNFRVLAYQYRQEIPKADLPPDVTKRPDCYWGKNCRTQKKLHHASNFNHICEQTKF